MIYGTIHILQEFVTESNKKATWLLAELTEMSNRCKQAVENGSRMNAQSLAMQEAAKLNQHIVKSEGTIRSRHNIPIGGGGGVPNRRFL
ncbi:hypothetical protein B9Z55_008199 [Caenorhabditis nigoni]|nr:hypothetical protein B9Z55_008199 [Caenorhabditis nigoni]